jgi:hypothetical protein
MNLSRPWEKIAFAALSIQGLANSRNGQTTGFGDLELGVGWLYAEGPWKVRADGTLVLPTGKNSTTPGPDIGLGNFYTLRPEAQLTYLTSNQWAFSGKAVLGFNTRNRDNQLKRAATGMVWRPLLAT